jgi:hypothetical protein
MRAADPWMRRGRQLDLPRRHGFEVTAIESRIFGMIDTALFVVIVVRMIVKPGGIVAAAFG